MVWKVMLGILCYKAVVFAVQFAYYAVQSWRYGRLITPKKGEE